MSAEKPEVGDVFKENDPRARGREVKVLEVSGSYVVCKSLKTQRTTKIDISVFGKTARRGFTFVRHDAVMQW